MRAPLHAIDHLSMMHAPAALPLLCAGAWCLGEVEGAVMMLSHVWPSCALWFVIVFVFTGGLV
jgi:hypothetical protein